MHYLYGGIRLQSTHDRLSGAAQVQLSVLLGLFVLAKAVDYWLDRFDLVTRVGRLITGMTYTDDNAVLPAKEILMGIALICAVLFFANVWRRTWLLPSVGLALLVLSAVLLGLIWPGIVQQFQVDPTEAGQGGAVHRAATSTRRARRTTSTTSRSTPYAEHDASPTTASSTRSTAQTVVGAAGRPAAGRARPSSSTSRCAPTTRCADVLDVDRYEIDGTDRAAGARRARARPERHHRRRPATGPTCTPSTPTATA